MESATVESESVQVPLLDLLKQIQLPFIEVGGPTLPDKIHPTPYRLVDIKKLPKSLITSNVELGHLNSEWKPETAEWEEIFSPDPDLQTDARELPFQNESVGAIFASALPYSIRRSTLRELSRVLAPGGLVIWQYGDIRDEKKARQVGLITIGKLNIGTGGYDYVFKKPVPMKDSQTRRL